MGKCQYSPLQREAARCSSECVAIRNRWREYKEEFLHDHSHQGLPLSPVVLRELCCGRPVQGKAGRSLRFCC